MSPVDNSGSSPKLGRGRPKRDAKRPFNLHLSAVDFTQIQARCLEQGISVTQYICDAVAMALGRRQRQRSHPSLDIKLSRALAALCQDRILRYNALTEIRDQLQAVARIHGPLPFAAFDVKLAADNEQTLEDILYLVDAYVALKGKTSSIANRGGPLP